MALETLKNITKIGGFEVKRIEWDHPKGNFIELNGSSNAITFKIQDGPIKKAGVNGCQVDTMIETARLILEGLNAKFPCRENAVAITKLDEAIMWLERRQKDRTERGAEGLNLK
jgi:hypothetical protein